MDYLSNWRKISWEIVFSDCCDVRGCVSFIDITWVEGDGSIVGDWIKGGCGGCKVSMVNN